MNQNEHMSFSEDDAWQSTGAVVAGLNRLLREVGEPLAAVTHDTEQHTVELVQRSMALRASAQSLCEQHGLELPETMRQGFVSLLGSAQFQDMVSQRLARLQSTFDQMQQVIERVEAKVDEQNTDVVKEALDLTVIIDRYLEEENRHSKPADPASKERSPRGMVTLF